MHETKTLRAFAGDPERYISHISNIPTMKTAFDGMRSWQVIKGFDKSEIHDVFSIYRKSTLVKSRLWCGAINWQSYKESKNTNVSNIMVRKTDLAHETIGGSK